MGIKILGIFIIVLAIYTLKIGLRFDDKELFYIPSIRLIGISTLLFIGGISLLPASLEKQTAEKNILKMSKIEIAKCL